MLPILLNLAPYVVGLIVFVILIIVIFAVGASIKVNSTVKLIVELMLVAVSAWLAWKARNEVDMMIRTRVPGAGMFMLGPGQRRGPARPLPAAARAAGAYQGGVDGTLAPLQM